MEEYNIRFATEEDCEELSKLKHDKSIPQVKFLYKIAE